jgi:hypothetical protein
MQPHRLMVRRTESDLHTAPPYAKNSLASRCRGRAEEWCNRQNRRPPNGPTVKLRGQGLRAEAGAARRLPACEVRVAGGVTPCKYR